MMEGLSDTSGGLASFNQNQAHEDVIIPNHDSTPISGLTQAPHASPSMPVIRLEAQELGIPNSPSLRVLSQGPDNDSDEEDVQYDSDGNMHPPFDRCDVEGALNVDEEEVVAEINPPEESSEIPTLTPELIDAMTVAVIKGHLKDRNQSCTGRKADLAARLKVAVASGAPLIQNMTDEQRENMGGQGFHSLAHWVVMDPSDEPINEEGLARAPTVPESEREGMGATKKNYVKRFDRELFMHEVLLPKRDVRGRIRIKNEKVEYEKQSTDETVPNIHAINEAGLNCDSHPAMWFNLFMPKEKQRQANPDVVSLSDFTSWTNTKAVMENAGPGGVVYPEYVPFTNDELMQHLGLYIVQGLSPSPQVSMKFQSPTSNPVNGSQLVYESFGKNAERRHRHFKRFFACTNPMSPLQSRKTNPNQKVNKFFKHAIKVSKELMFIGRYVSCDEQTIGM